MDHPNSSLSLLRDERAPLISGQSVESVESIDACRHNLRSIRAHQSLQDDNMTSCSSKENIVGAASSTDDNGSKFLNTFDVVVSQLEGFHVDSQQAKQTIEGSRSNELDNTVESLSLSVSAMNVASTSTKKETPEFRAVGTKKSKQDNPRKWRYRERVQQFKRRKEPYTRSMGSFLVRPRTQAAITGALKRSI